MICNYLKTAWRAALKHPLLTTLNIGGLSLGIAACLAIIVYVEHELSYDTTHPGFERIYRLTEIINGEGHIEKSSSNPFPVLPALVADHGDLIDGYARLFDFQIPTKSVRLEDDRLFSEHYIYYTDSTVLDLLDIPLIRGDKNALVKPFSIVLTERLAHKYFGDEDPIGQVLFLGGLDKLKCTVTGIIGKGGHSHIRAEALVSIETCRTMAPFVYQNWVWNPCWTYIRLKEGVTKEHFESLMPGFVQKNYPEFNRHMVTHQLQPISDIHLKSELEFEIGQNSSMKYIYIFISSAIILLVIACVNFVNLSTISLLSRAKEAGMRKVAGATRWEMVGQVLLESLVYTLVAVVAGFIMLSVLYPVLQNTFNVELDFTRLMRPARWLFLLVMVLVIALFSGLYPAMVFSDTSAVSLFRGSATHLGKGKWFRRALVVVQFSVAALLIVFTMVSQRQLRYMQERDKGFDAKNVLIFNIQTTQVQGQLEAFKRALTSHSGVLSATVMNDIFGIGNNNHEFNHEGMEEGQWSYFPALIVDEDFVKTFDITLLAGRDFDHTRNREDSTAVIVNQAMAKWLGHATPEDAVGRQLKTLSGDEKIVGVTNDFHYRSLHHPVGPFVLDIADRPSHQYIFFAANVAVKVANRSDEVMAHLEDTWNAFVNNKPFEFLELDKEITNQYRSEQHMAVLLRLFSVLAMIVAFMGLFALTWFVSKAKTKEIAIRKVHGASLTSLLKVAMREQLTLVVFSFTIGFPMAYLLLDQWLQTFAYRVAQGTSVYVLAAVIALATASLTMLYHALSAAQKNPADVLKYE